MGFLQCCSSPGPSSKTCSLHTAYIFTPDKTTVFTWNQPLRDRQSNRENWAFCKLSRSQKENRSAAVPETQTMAHSSLASRLLELRHAKSHADLQLYRAAGTSRSSLHHEKKGPLPPLPFKLAKPRVQLPLNPFLAAWQPCLLSQGGFQGT